MRREQLAHAQDRDALGRQQHQQHGRISRRQAGIASHARIGPALGPAPRAAAVLPGRTARSAEATVPAGQPGLVRALFFWLLDARQAVTAQSPGAPVLPTRPLGGQQPRDGLAVTVNAGPADPFRLKMTRDGTSWLVAGQSLAGVAHTKRLLLYAEVLAGPFVLLAMFFGCLAVGQRALAPVEQSRRRQLEFTADASHELRTPLSVIRAETDVALSTPRDAAGYRDALVRVQGESARARALGWPSATRSCAPPAAAGTSVTRRSAGH
jgi:signal transduction histidine kinase